MNFKSSWDILATSLFTKCWHFENSWLNLFQYIWQVILFHFLLNLKKVPAKFLCDSLVHCYLVAWYFVPFGSVYWSGYTPIQSRFKCIESSISTLEDFNWFQRLCAVGSNEQSYRNIITKVQLICDIFQVLSLPKLSWFCNIIIANWEIWSATLRPSNAVDLVVNSPFNVLIVSEAFLPDIPRSFVSWSNMNIPWLKLSRRA